MVWWDCFHAEHISQLGKAAELGYELIELAVEAGSLPPADPLHRELELNGLDVTVCCLIPPDCTLVDPSPQVRAAALKNTKRVLDFAHAVGADKVVGPLYTNGRSATPRSREQRRDEYAQMVDSLARVAEYARSVGITLCIEPLNRYKTDQLNTVLQTMDFIRETGADNIRVLFDTYHANIEESDLLRALRDLGTQYLGEVHLCDNQKGAPGSGHIDFPSIAAFLRETAYGGPVVFESFVPFAKDNIWTPLAPTQDELAAEAYRYICRVFS